MWHTWRAAVMGPEMDTPFPCVSSGAAAFTAVNAVPVNTATITAGAKASAPAICKAVAMALQCNEQ